MAPYYPLYIRRSDGRLEIKTTRGKEKNEPQAEQLDSKPNAQGMSDFYRECQVGDAKELDWRKKLAGMLMREIGGKEAKDRNHILAALPENYRLFEHVKCKYSDVDGKAHKVTKNHAAGGNERQDAYLYGHPQGRKKRYRSPAEFFPHVLWLATDEAGDSNNCTCKFCSPEELEEDKVSFKAKQEKQAAATKAVEASSKAGVSNSDPRQKPPQSQQPQTQPRPQPNPEIARPSPHPRLRSPEQKTDCKFDEFYYRPGEVVWFARGGAWGLGAIASREINQRYAHSQRQYYIQPLSYPGHSPTMIASSQEHLRPWLAWSPPPCTCAQLDPTRNGGHVFTYDSVDWQAYLAGRYGPGEAEVDASILAAKSVDVTYTLFDRIEAKTSTSGASQLSEIYYNGIFFGGEKIWVGDPLRLRNTHEASDIFVLQTIIERTNPQESSQSLVSLVGDIHSMRMFQLDPDSYQEDDSHLPQRVRADLHARNAITSQNPNPNRNYTSYWKLKTPLARLGLADIKGRWYESSLFMPMIDPDGFHTARVNGEIGDPGMYMNGQGDCWKDGQRTFRGADTKVKRREDAFSRAVASGFRISKGADDAKRDKDVKMEDVKRAPEPAAAFPAHQYEGASTASVTGGYGVQSTLPEAGFEQYMKFDDTEGDHGMGGVGQHHYQQGMGEHGFYGHDAMPR